MSCSSVTSPGASNQRLQQNKSYEVLEVLTNVIISLLGRQFPQKLAIAPLNRTKSPTRTLEVLYFFAHSYPSNRQTSIIDQRTKQVSRSYRSCCLAITHSPFFLWSIVHLQGQKTSAIASASAMANASAISTEMTVWAALPTPITVDDAFAMAFLTTSCSAPEGRVNWLSFGFMALILWWGPCFPLLAFCLRTGWCL